MLQASTSQYIVYGDLNCPYSYALHERLKALNLLDIVDYRLVEHAQDIGLYGNTPDMLAELASDVFSIRSYASEVTIALPPERPDSRFAILCVIAAAHIDNKKAGFFRDLFYKAMWIDGLDIASPTVIFDCLQAAGLPTELSIDMDAEEILEEWQDRWEGSQTGSRVPVIFSPDNRKLVGLASIDEIKAFFAGEDNKVEHDSRQICKYSEHHTIAVFASEGLAPVWQLIDALRSDYNILLPATLGDLKQQLETAEQTPDLLLIHATDDWLNNLLQCQRLIQNKHNAFVPIALIGADNDDKQELQAYAHGASDYLVQDRAAGIIRARISMMLELKRSRDFLERSARIDGLTGVNNRREFEKTLEMEWRRSARTRQPLSLIMLDVDHFKAFNDRYGHLAGDSCLRRIASAMQTTVNRSHDAVCRYGGEEFVVLLPDTDKKGAALVAQAIRDHILSLGIAHERSSTGLVVTVSQGVATLIPSSSNNPHELVEQADQALYKAKNTQRNCVVAA
ncbi:diguanylate cyclase [Neptunomonas antarctica]|uniref:diguanylate cyclase n=1 Tax=Neptunomonas antarctica TaxID=619304 RepID=A0A1N7IS41_9GAMM|nr:diguanylate cyclase [Neptunomonas antarctica]SIS39791.1 diguanylate cyclase (GGDEF) domain-containing protein [Neptunomonas antarctica]